MYLSKLTIDVMDRRLMKIFSDIYLLHQFVMSGFSEYENLERVLFRLEPEIKHNTAVILIQSHQKPQWTDIVEQLNGTSSCHVKEFKPQFQKKSIFRFRLRANPVVTRGGKRRGLMCDEALLDWLSKKSGKIGASFLGVMAIDEGYAVGSRRKGNRVDRLNIKTARFEGRLVIEEPERFRESFIAGIGSAKSFGCGLLSLAKG